MANGENWNPKFGISEKYKNWIAHLDLKTCKYCRDYHGKIWLIDETPEKEPRLHPNCRCVIIEMTTIEAGTATINGRSGADWYLKYYIKLPDYYVGWNKAKEKGWRKGKWPSNFIPGKMLFGIFYNSNGHLPLKDGRIWYEADINYNSGKRNSQRILWSNDGLIFVTFDHYKTFFEII